MSILPDGGWHRETQALLLSGMARSEAGYSGVLQKVGAKGGKEWKWQRDIVAQWESERHRSWSMPVEGFNGHVATDGSLLGRTVKWRACGWAVVQLVYDENMGPLHGMCGSVEAEVEVQRTIKRAEVTAFLCHRIE